MTTSICQSCQRDGVITAQTAPVDANNGSDCVSNAPHAQEFIREFLFGYVK